MQDIQTNATNENKDLRATQLCVAITRVESHRTPPLPLLECEPDRNGTDFSCPLPTCPLSLDLSIFWLRVCFPGTIVTLMEASFFNNHSFQSVCLYSTFLLHIEVWWYTYCDLFTQGGGRRLKLASHAWDHEQRCQRSILRIPRWPWEAIRGGCRAFNWLPLH